MEARASERERERERERETKGEKARERRRGESDEGEVRPWLDGFDGEKEAEERGREGEGRRLGPTTPDTRRVSKSNSGREETSNSVLLPVDGRATGGGQ